MNSRVLRVLFSILILMLVLTIGILCCVVSYASGPDEIIVDIPSDEEEITMIVSTPEKVESTLSTEFTSSDLPLTNESVSSEPENIDSSALLSEVQAIRQTTDFFVYGLIPVTVAAVLVVMFFRWFYRTFASGALG